MKRYVIWLVVLVTLLLSLNIVSAKSDSIEIHKGDVITVDADGSLNGKDVYAYMLLYINDVDIDRGKVTLNLELELDIQGKEDTVEFSKDNIRLIKGVRTYTINVKSDNKTYDLGTLSVRKVFGEDKLELKISGNLDYYMDYKTKKQSSTSNVNNIEVEFYPSQPVVNEDLTLLIRGVYEGSVGVLMSGKTVVSRVCDIKTNTGIQICNLGKVPEGVNRIELTIYNNDGDVLDYKVYDVDTTRQQQISLTVIPSVPVPGRGMTLLTDDLNDGKVVLITEFGSYQYDLSNGISTIQVPDDGSSYIILIVKDSDGKTVYRKTYELESATSSISISTMKKTYSVNEDININVNGLKGGSNARLIVEKDGSRYTSRTFTGNTVKIKIPDTGSYRLYVVQGSSRSNYIDINVGKQQNFVIGTISSNNLVVGKTVSVAVTKGAEYTLRYPSGREISGISQGTVSFTLDEPGSYTLEASLNGETKDYKFNVKNDYVVSYDIVDGWLLHPGYVKFTITDTKGKPATGQIIVDGNSYPVVNGYAKIEMTSNEMSGNFISSDGITKSFSITKQESGDYTWLVGLLVIVIIAVGFYRYKKSQSVGGLFKLKKPGKDVGAYDDSGSRRILDMDEEEEI